MLAVTRAIVLAIGVIALQVHFVSELLAAEILFALAFVALVGIASSLYLVGMTAESIERCFAAALHGLADFYRRLHSLPTGAAIWSLHPGASGCQLQVRRITGHIPDQSLSGLLQGERMGPTVVLSSECYSI